jgi:heme-degrading monooxygenase HmoA
VILEVAVLNVKRGTGSQFEEAFREASKIIREMRGYISHELHRCIEADDRYLLLVQWATLTDHEIGFRQSAEYQQWKKLLHHFYDPFPTVEHYESVLREHR